MSRDPQRLADYLDHVLQAIDRVQRYAGAMGADDSCATRWFKTR